MEWVLGGVILAALLLVGLGGWRVARQMLQLCPHCGWVVQRVRSGWLRCPRCHRQYGRQHKVRP